jgi:hypothetical protein
MAPIGGMPHVVRTDVVTTERRPPRLPQGEPGNGSSAFRRRVN